MSAIWVLLTLGLGAPARAAEPEDASPTAPWQSLDVPGFEPAWVWVPEGAERLPVIVVTHGAGGAAEWHGARYRELLGDRAILVCPRGRRINHRVPSEGYYYPDHFTLAREVHQALVALGVRYRTRIDAERLVYAGYSQGATMGVLGLGTMRSPFKRLILVEGGTSGWTAALARRLREQGLERALFVCGTQGCKKGSLSAVGLLERVETRARSTTAAGSGHRPDGDVGERLAQALPWILEGIVPFPESTKGS
jgi:pimeloyl-ACP methyl ester carboxylesterase